GRAVVAAPVVAPAVGVYVAAPPPPSLHVGVGVNLGGPPTTTVIEHRQVYEVRERHDNGRHRGWYKQGPPPPQPAGWRGNPPPAPGRGGGWRGNPPPAPAPAQRAGGWRGNPAPAPAPQASGWRGNPGGGNGKKHDGWRR